MEVHLSTTDLAPVQIRSFDKLYIGGKWVEPSSDAIIESVSPITEEVIATVPAGKAADIDAAVAAARKAFDEGPWPRLSPKERADYLVRIREELAKRVPELVDAFTAEIGAANGASVAFTNNALKMFDDASTLWERFEWVKERSWDNGSGYITYDPVGVVGVIIPWNGPVATAALKMAPALAAGCTVVLKPASEAAAEIMMMAEAFEAAGLPEGVVSIVPAAREDAERLAAHPDVDKITFTGSTAVGKRLMELASDRIARITLELGGKSAAIIADDIPVEDFVPGLAFAGIGHSGQVCAAITRILVPRERQDEIIEALKQVYESVKVGDPREPDTALGPLSSARQRERVLNYIEIGKEEGARVVTGGKAPEHLERGYYVEPTLFADVRPDMRIAQEEIFGPVVVVIPFDSIDEAVEIANGTVYGLSGAVYAKDHDLAVSIANRVRTGQISINGWDMCVTQPFGGFKQSGLGREGNVEGLSAFLEPKLVQGATPPAK
ncbi:aldehyde dehydrogenase [Gulosibacter chungangensis]|uniref:Aldehyde dehydrogenase n=1 Tax=Gulosibacter chungangensis TaxID=979746 RepID=A0A7J5BFV9_9MICO|nr:aldehyde dehydrogenase [Gulosibacter chungangensis]